MARGPSLLRTLHRADAVLTLSLAIVLVVLRLTGLISDHATLTIVLVVEVPLLLLFVVVTILRFRRRPEVTSPSRTSLLDRLVDEEPLLRPAVYELRAFAALLLLLGGKRRVPPGAIPFGYTRGTMTLPLVLIVLSAVELVVVHFLVPWDWLRLLLLILTIWGVLFMLGVLALRVVHPHLVHEGRLHLRWGRDSVLATPLVNIRRAVRLVNHAHTQPEIIGQRLVLTAFQSTNVLILFAEPVVAVAPVSKRRRPPGFRAVEAQLYVDRPDDFVEALNRSPDTAGS